MCVCVEIRKEGWMDGWMKGYALRTHEYLFVGVRGKICRSTSGWMDGWMEGWMDGTVDGWKEGWLDGCGSSIDRSTVCDRLLDVCVRVVSVSSHLHWMHESVFLLYYKPNSTHSCNLIFS